MTAILRVRSGPRIMLARHQFRLWIATYAKYPDCRMGQPFRHIATAPELWFENLGKSPLAAPPAEERGPIGAPYRERVLICKDTPGAARTRHDDIRRRSNDDDAGA